MITRLLQGPVHHCEGARVIIHEKDQSLRRDRQSLSCIHESSVPPPNAQAHAHQQLVAELQFARGAVNAVFHPAEWREAPRPPLCADAPTVATAMRQFDDRVGPFGASGREPPRRRRRRPALPLETLEVLPYVVCVCTDCVNGRLALGKSVSGTAPSPPSLD